jgi:uncharacterized protein
VIFHGGEPLLAGAERLVALAQNIRSALALTTSVEFGLQTNGLLLSDKVLSMFASERIAISLSLDGPESINDLHRTTRRGRSSFKRVMKAARLLQQHPTLYAGLIAVIEPSARPKDLFAFFSQLEPPKLDFLLPDANHLRLPPGRVQNPDLYRDWLIEAFDVWFDHYPTLPVRMFEALLDTAAGLPSHTDAFGLGDVSLLTIETDGSYHDLDVLKITHEGATSLGLHLSEHTITSVASHPAIQRHRLLLRKEGLSTACRSCEEVDICGGGSLPHRFGREGFANPTVYCAEMLALIRHIRKRLQAAVAAADVSTALDTMPEFDLGTFELAEQSKKAISDLREAARHDASEAFWQTVRDLASRDASAASASASLLQLKDSHKRALAGRPGAIAWQRAMASYLANRPVFAVDGSPLQVDVEYLNYLATRVDQHEFEVAENDTWLRKPFGNAIHFEPPNVACEARPLVDEALDIIGGWRPALGAELQHICQAVQFVRDPSAHPDKIVSFSDNAVPGALYVSVMKAKGFIDPFDLADSLIHEYRHQKLYLLERKFPMVYPTALKVISPWREDLRPPSGLFHAIFVFVELRRFWQHVRDSGPKRLRDRALNQLQDTDENLARGFETLKSCPLTKIGRALAEVLDHRRLQ